MRDMFPADRRWCGSGVCAWIGSVSGNTAAVRLAGVLGLTIFATAGSHLHAQSPPLWGGISPGDWEVGFRSEWILDSGRTYEAVFDDGSYYGVDNKAPRPILVNVWYPVVPDPDASHMPHRGYLKIAPDEPELMGMAAALARYNRRVLARQVIGQGIHDDRTAALFQASLDLPTASRREAPAARGPFPVVIYHAGHSSSYEDNSVLCEVLASRGYVVIGSAFQRGDGSGLEVDTRSASIADIEELIRHARQWVTADWSRLALVGHSGGAQLALRYAVRPGAAVDAYVSLDTTQDYWGFSLDFWPHVRHVLENREHFTAPVLVAANPHAVFMLADSLDEADRYYVTVEGLEHDQFISQGLMTSDFQARAAGDSVPEGGPESMRRAAYRGDPLVMDRYQLLVMSVVGFLDAHLRGDRAALRWLRDPATTTEGNSGLRIEHVPRGVSSAPDYVHAAERPPSPRQMRPLLDRIGVERTVEILKTWSETAAGSPVLRNPEFAVALLHELVTGERRGEARRLYGFYSELHDGLIGAYLRWYDLFADMDDLVTAREWLDVARVLDPDHPEVLSRLSGGW